MWAVLGICGSLRRNSHNAALLRLAGRSNPDVCVVGGDLAGRLPLFNPDLDNDEELPEVVTRFRSCADRAEGVIIATPSTRTAPPEPPRTPWTGWSAPEDSPGNRPSS